MRCLRCTECETECAYRRGLQETADLVAAELGLPHHSIAWQSAGRTADPWWGPPLEDVIDGLAAEGFAAVVVCSAGFVADHPGIWLVRARAPELLKFFPAERAQSDHIYVVDPVGNLMMRYPRDLDPNRMKEDVARLISLSRGWVEVK